MAGIYIHIPFCKRKCSYCNFFSKADDTIADFVDCLLKEIYLQQNYLSGQLVETIYFGGGTPSLLSIKQLQRIVETIYKVFSVSTNAEVTFEANPDGLTEEYIGNIFDYSPVNRFSIGIQSFDDEDLKFLNRLHSGQQARKAIDNVLNAGFSNISIDFIYGIPTLTDEKWVNNLTLFFNYNLPHLSAYSLTVEPNTILSKQIARGIVPPVDEEKSIAQMNILISAMQEHHYEHYEISNFAKQGFYSKHNSNYWNGVHYLGLGPSAHSFNGTSRQWNIADIQEYVFAINAGRLNFQQEVLSSADCYNEYIMTSLRTQWGISRSRVRTLLGESQLHNLDRQMSKYVLDKKMVNSNDHYILTNFGKLFADAIAADLFL